MVWEFLSEQGWVDYRRASETISEFLVGAETILPPDSVAGRAVLDLIHLNAAELAVPVGLREPRANAPFLLEVPRQAARVAIYVSDSSPFWGHDPTEQARLWDVTLYSSDASKLAWLSETESPETLAERFIPAVTRLAALQQRLHESRAEWQYDDPTFWEPSAFAALATLWRAKLAVVLREEEFSDSLWEVYRSIVEPASSA
jgi:hypothetical protein